MTQRRRGESGALRQRGAATGRANLVYTSAGRWANVRQWLVGRRNFDLWITDYDDRTGSVADVADCFNARRDSKFGNLKHAYETWPDRFSKYRAVLVADDDLRLSGEQISRLFDLRDELDLWLLQPAFNPLGKVSWEITRARWECRLRYTNFVEMTCPLFRRDKLDAFMSVFDPILTGTGTDWWFMHVLGEDIAGKVAIVDDVPCVNPLDSRKGGVRECDRLETEAERTAAWCIVQEKYGVARRPQVETGRVLKPAVQRWLSQLVHLPVDGYAKARQMVWAMKQAVREWPQRR